jgi:CcmD family protein
MTDIPLLVVALVVFCGLWAYLFNLDARVKRLKEEIREDEE